MLIIQAIHVHHPTAITPGYVYRPLPTHVVMVSYTGSYGELCVVIVGDGELW